MVLGLHILSIFFETGLGVWIFSKSFPARKEWLWQQTVNEVLLHLLILLVALFNFGRAIPTAGKCIIVIVWVGLLLFYRCIIFKKGKTEDRYMRVIDSCLEYAEFFAITGLLAWNYWIGYISIGMILAGNIWVAFFYYKYYKCRWLQAYIWEVLYISTIQIVKCAYLVYVGGVERNSVLVMNVFGKMHTYSAVLWGMFICVLVLVLVAYFSVYNVLQTLLDSYKWHVVFLVITEVLLLNFFIKLGKDGINTGIVTQVWFIAITVMLGVVISVLGLFKNAVETEKRLLSMRNEKIEEQYKELSAAYEEKRCLLHDEKQRLQYLEECLRNGEIERGLEFLGRCREKIQVQPGKVWTGIPTLDFILNVKWARMESSSVQFTIDLNLHELPVDELDAVVLLGNLFDNAVEAAEKCPAGKRWIELMLCTVNSMFIIVMRNTSIEKPLKQGSRFITSKKNRDSHGCGTQSMQNIVEGYQGSIDFDYCEEVFQAQVMIPL